MGEKAEVMPEIFNRKNYFSWEFQLRLFVKGKDLWGHIDGTIERPSEKDKYGKWETNDAKIMSWITSCGSRDCYQSSSLFSKRHVGIFEYYL